MKVLALSGGGFRGLFTVQVLAEIEKATDKKITDHFDLITGTSIGGIIALALAHGIRPFELVDHFKEKGASIFPSPLSKKSACFNRLLYKVWSLKAFKTPLYDGEGLKSFLKDLFGDSKLKELSHAYVMVPAA